MNLFTRSDFDGVICAAMLKQLNIIETCKFVHPNDIASGKIEVTNNDVLANVPYAQDCALWFDHHQSEQERRAYRDFNGSCWPAASTARIIFDYYGGSEKFGKYVETMINAVDKLSAGDLKREEIINPKGDVLLGFLLDPRTGLGRYHKFSISNYKLANNMTEWCQSMPIEEILRLPDVLERIDLYFEQAKQFEEMLLESSKVIGNVVVTDLRGREEIFVGNRFYIYSLFPECNISVLIADLKEEKGFLISAGHSVLNDSCKINIGSLMLKYGGGGRPHVGGCQIRNDENDEKLNAIINVIISKNN